MPYPICLISIRHMPYSSRPVSIRPMPYPRCSICTQHSPHTRQHLLGSYCMAGEAGLKVWAVAQGQTSPRQALSRLCHAALAVVHLDRWQRACEGLWQVAMRLPRVNRVALLMMMEVTLLLPLLPLLVLLLLQVRLLSLLLPGSFKIIISISSISIS